MQRYIFIGALWLLLNHTVYTIAQKSITLANLPPCARSCADTAAVAVGCDTSDISCLCSHQSFSTATIQCSSSSCRPDSLSLTMEVLTELCSSLSTTTSSTTTGSISTSSTSATSTSSTSSTSSTFTTTSATVPVSPAQSTTQSASSTVVVVQTVVVAQPSTTIASGAERLHIGSISMSTRALATLIFGIPPLILVVAVI